MGVGATQLIAIEPCRQVHWLPLLTCSSAFCPSTCPVPNLRTALPCRGACHALQGQDPEPDRSHIFWVSGWDASERVYGGELARRVGRLLQEQTMLSLCHAI